MNTGDTRREAHTFIHQHSCIHTHIDLSRQSDERVWLGLAWLRRGRISCIMGKEQKHNEPIFRTISPPVTDSHEYFNASLQAFMPVVVCKMPVAACRMVYFYRFHFGGKELKKLFNFSLHRTILVLIFQQKKIDESIHSFFFALLS